MPTFRCRFIHLLAGTSGFAWESQFTSSALCFGLLTAPLVFPRVMAPCLRDHASSWLVGSQAVSGLPRDYDSDYSFEGFPNPQADREVFSSSPRLFVHPVSSSVRLEATVRDHVVHVCSGSRIQAPDVCSSDPVQCGQSSPAGRFSVEWDSYSVVVRRLYLQVGMSLGESLPNLCLFTDAWDTGWGASLGDVHLSGSWSHLSSRISTNH